MGMLIIMEMLLSFVILPLVVTLATLVTCGNSRPNHQLKVANNYQKGPEKTKKNLVKMEQYGKDKSGSKRESKKLSETQKTRSTGSRSYESISKSRKRRSSSIKRSQHTEPLASSGISTEVK
ncbi:hypothetical protein LOAG_17455 [Loa loa]|uniref:Uncharacterized protein n=1 Tax=Loa loa TaxID=7209 RepID=A0A1S0UKR1_LOALO|nr:hypothetical protein LOAG_17455 [Loa loa]EJD75384.1 hypothetical protein LOAG_17455 [Loa loa]